MTIVAFYLPQYHPTAENDRWWGPGFTEWRNVARARPLFRDHQQPHVPGELGFTDLRLAETREAQAALASAHGIDAFCYHHYWFMGRRLLHRPLDEVIALGHPDLPFCLSWANESWRRSWDGASGETLLEQEHTDDDDLAHVRWMAPVLDDRRYLRFDGRAVVLVYRAAELPDARRTTDTWRAEADRLGVGPLWLCRVDFPEERGDPAALGFDAAVEFQPRWATLGPGAYQSRRWAPARRLRLVPDVYRRHVVHDYSTLVAQAMAAPPPAYVRYPGVTPGFDNSARRTEGALIIRRATPARYESWLRHAIDGAAHLPGAFVFVNAWNEWAEGCHLEPDRRHGREFLEATARAAGGVERSPRARVG